MLSRMRNAPGAAQGRPLWSQDAPQTPPSPLITLTLWVSVHGWGFADFSSGWFREQSDACRMLTGSRTRRGSCFCSTRGTSCPCGLL